MDVYGGLHPVFLADIRGLADCIARGAAGRMPSPTADAAASADAANDLLTLLSFELQRQLFKFFEVTLDPPRG
jgi:hypothetical protein